MNRKTVSLDQAPRSQWIWCVTTLLAAIVGIAPSALAQAKETVLYSFQGGSDGDGPVGSIVLDQAGNIYGATTYTLSCITLFQCGAVYQLSPSQQAGGPWTETTLHEFQGHDNGDGGAPGGGLIQDAAGNLYGTTSYGGAGPCLLLGDAVGCGAVYELVRPTKPGEKWTEKILYNFQGGQDGQFPFGDLVFDKAGNLYGATWFGGGKGDTCNFLYPYCGTIFKLSPVKKAANGPWTETVMYSFQGLETGDGGQPNGGLVFDESGAIYGTTSHGGSVAGNRCGTSGCGTVFKLTPPSQNDESWTETILHTFLNTRKDGGQPNGNLIRISGVLLGTTEFGGSYGEGTVYALRTGQDGVWTETLLHVFDVTNGASPFGLIVGPDKKLYGTAGVGPRHAGIIYRMDPPAKKGAAWNFTILYNFTGPPDGMGPGLLKFGNGNRLFGTTAIGGTGQCEGGGCGTVFNVVR